MTAARAGALVAAVLVAVAGCGIGRGDTGATGDGDSPAPATPPVPSASAASSLVAKANLQRCPRVRRASPGTTGRSLPTVTLPCLGAGPAVPLGGLRGPLVLNLWATWCEPCREEAPLFQRLHSSTDDVDVVGVDTKDRVPDAALAFAADRGLRYPSLYDPQGRVLAAARAGNGLPVTLLVDRAGRIVHTKIGPYTSYRQLTADVRDHLAVRP